MWYRLVVKALVAGLIVLSAPATAAGAVDPTETPDTSDTCCTPTPEPQGACPALGSSGINGAESGPVPDVMGQTLESARAELAQGGFRTTYAPSDAAADWTVIDQTPTGVEIAECGSDVTLDLEAPPVEVPDVVGLPVESAKDRIQDAGLEPSVAGDASAEAAVVDSQDPAAGTTAARGTTVTLNLRTTPTPESDRVKVPDLSGLSADAARRRLEGRGLTLVVGSGDSGKVSTQDPAAGSLVDRGSSVTVVLTPGSGPVDTDTPEATPTDDESGGGEESPGVDTVDSAETGSSSDPPFPLLLLVIAVLAVLGWALRRARRGQEPQPSAPSVVCVPYADPSPQVEFRDVAPSFRLDFVCYHDQGRQEIREIVR